MWPSTLIFNYLCVWGGLWVCEQGPVKASCVLSPGPAKASSVLSPGAGLQVIVNHLVDAGNSGSLQEQCL